MGIIKTIIIKERATSWALKLKIEGSDIVPDARPLVMATFAKRPIGLVLLATAFNKMKEVVQSDFNELHCSAAGLQKMAAVGIEIDRIDDYRNTDKKGR